MTHVQNLPAKYDTYFVAEELSLRELTCNISKESFISLKPYNVVIPYAEISYLAGRFLKLKTIKNYSKLKKELCIQLMSHSRLTMTCE